ncbi:MAG: ABC transporter permease [Oscillospiraceae bacterium]|jgi:oligopeptide transport system permease protein|nr:ABC transporter permease [Oscillospiraceae bacterium]
MKRFSDYKISRLIDGFGSHGLISPAKADDVDLQDMQIDPSSVPDEYFVYANNDITEAERIGYSNYSYWRSTLQVFLKSKTAVGMLVFLLLVLAFTFIQPYLPNQKSPTAIHLNPQTNIQYRNVAPDDEFWFGTNSIGQDLWSRIWSGTRTSLFIGLCSALVSNVVGICLGAIWGYARKWDHILTEAYNVFDNIPYTVLRMLLIYIMRPSVPTIIIVMCMTGWIGMSKYIRNLILIHRDREYNLASRCLGTPARRIIVKNLLPQLVSVIVLQTALAIPAAIGSEVFLTYIGLGLPVDIPSLGNLINEGRKVMLVASQRYQIFFPMLAVSAITISFYALGNAFADAADPRNHR